LLTLTLRGAVVATFAPQEASVARAASVWLPEAALELAQLNSYRPLAAFRCAVLQAPPSTCTWTEATPLASETDTSTSVSLHASEAPAAGELIDSVGGVWSLQRAAPKVIHIGADQTSLPSACTAWTK